jgi:hypothetical protein
MLPDGLSSWSGGRWTHHGSSHATPGGIAVSGNQAWVANDAGVERFDGETWKRLPVELREPMATAAEGDQVWVINGTGMLAHCIADLCETHSIANQIRDDAWKSGILGTYPVHGKLTSRQRAGYKTLVRAHGRLWFIHDAAWYSSDGGQWTEWLGSANEQIWPLGYSGGRLWVKTLTSLLAIGDDLQATRFPLDHLDGPTVDSVNAGDGHPALAGGVYGLFERSGENWRQVPLDSALHADSVSTVSSTPGGTVWVIVRREDDIRRILAFAGFIGVALLLWNLVAMYREKRLSSLA